MPSAIARLVWRLRAKESEGTGACSGQDHDEDSASWITSEALTNVAHGSELGFELSVPTLDLGECPAEDSCENVCGNFQSGRVCQCDPQCVHFGDCCDDYEPVCSA